jgi:hypothetical protein
METLNVIAGLDPAIHLFRKKMDTRINPGHDAAVVPRYRDGV